MRGIGRRSKSAMFTGSDVEEGSDMLEPGQGRKGNHVLHVRGIRRQPKV